MSDRCEQRGLCEVALAKGVQDLEAQLAAARREVETVTRERDQARAAMLSALLRFGVEFMDPPDGGDVSLEEQVQRMARAFAASRAALEDVRRVEKWLSLDAYHKVQRGHNGLFAAYTTVRGGGTAFAEQLAFADSLEALGRALVQEAGDAAK